MMKDKTHTKETKQKMSEAAKGRIPWNKGKKILQLKEQELELIDFSKMNKDELIEMLWVIKNVYEKRIENFTSKLKRLKDKTNESIVLGTIYIPYTPETKEEDEKFMQNLIATGQWRYKDACRVLHSRVDVHSYFWILERKFLEVKLVNDEGKSCDTWEHPDAMADRKKSK